jgi:hypothetical protein
VTVYRWVLRCTALLADAATPGRHAVGRRWQVDQTSVKVAGQWRYVYRAIDQFGQVIDVFVSARRDAIRAGREALSREHLAVPRQGGHREALRVLQLTRAGAVKVAADGRRHLKALLVTAPSRCERRWVAGPGYSRPALAPPSRPSRPRRWRTEPVCWRCG